MRFCVIFFLVFLTSYSLANLIDPEEFERELRDVDLTSVRLSSKYVEERDLYDLDEFEDEEEEERQLKSRFPSVESLDLDAYSGIWYQTHASSLPNRTYEKDLVCISANYELGSKSLLGIFKEVPVIEITNVGLKGTKDADKSTLPQVVGKGVAWQFFHKYPGSLVLTMPQSKVEGKRKPQIPLGGYKIILLPEVDATTGRYEWAVVMGGSGSLFILVRDIPYFKENLQEFLLGALDDAGFNKPWNTPLETYQGEDCMYPSDYGSLQSSTQGRRVVRTLRREAYEQEDEDEIEW